VLKFDPATQQPPSLKGPAVRTHQDEYGWLGGALANDGVIYFVPYQANQVLAIDPLKELSMTMKKYLRRYPEKLGRLFRQSGKSYSESLFESAVRKFGYARALSILDECLPSDEEWAERRVLDCVPLFVLVASTGGTNDAGICDVPLDVIYHLVRRNVHGLWTI